MYSFWQLEKGHHVGTGINFSRQGKEHVGTGINPESWHGYKPGVCTCINMLAYVDTRWHMYKPAGAVY